MFLDGEHFNEFKARRKKVIILWKLETNFFARFLIPNFSVFVFNTRSPHIGESAEHKTTQLWGSARGQPFAAQLDRHIHQKLSVNFFIFWITVQSYASLPSTSTSREEWLITSCWYTWLLIRARIQSRVTRPPESVFSDRFSNALIPASSHF